MTALQQWQAPSSETVQYVPSVQDQAITRLAEWAQSAQAAYEVATRIVQTSFVPDQFRNKPGEATAAILAGLEVGLQPMAALRAFDVIQGVAAPKAITQRAVAQANGHDIELLESTATRCRVRCRRRGGNWQPVDWTIDRARQLGVTGKANWKNQPQAMLVARATSEAARLVAADALLGIAYSSEELADGVLTETAADAVASVAPVGSKRMSRTKPAAVEPVAEPEPPAEPSGMDEFAAETTTWVEPPELITPAQSKKLHAALNDAGLGDRAAGLAYISATVGREIETSKELSKDQASRVIQALEDMLADPADTDAPTLDGGA
jgi:hypothetical protein